MPPISSAILDHWEMCAVRNILMPRYIGEPILDHWEMCAVRNRIGRAGMC